MKYLDIGMLPPVIFFNKIMASVRRDDESDVLFWTCCYLNHKLHDNPDHPFAGTTHKETMPDLIWLERTNIVESVTSFHRGLSAAYPGACVQKSLKDHINDK